MVIKRLRKNYFQLIINLIKNHEKNQKFVDHHNVVSFLYHHKNKIENRKILPVVGILKRAGFRVMTPTAFSNPHFPSKTAKN